MDHSQVGRAGELALQLYALVTSGGELELFEPVVDVDHVDLVAFRRGGVPGLAIQVKSADRLDRHGEVEGRASYPRGQVREHPGFVYAFPLLQGVTVAALWVVPSPDFNRLAYRHLTDREEILEFRARPQGDPRYAPFQLEPLQLGPKLLAMLDSLEEPLPRAWWQPGP